MVNMDGLLTFEFGTSDLINITLRLEYYLKKLHCYINRDLDFDQQTSLSTIVDLLRLLDKQELRSNYFKAYSQAAYLLKKINPDKICQTSLNQTLAIIDKQLTLVSKSSGKFAEHLRLNPFFKQLVQSHLTSAQDFFYQYPEYQYWSSQNKNVCQQDLVLWAKNFDEVQQLASNYLSLVRHAGPFQELEATQGYYQGHLDTRCLLVRLQIKQSLKLFPKMSFGQHGVSVQFYQYDHVDRAAHKYNKDISFSFANCYLG